MLWVLPGQDRSQQFHNCTQGMAAPTPPLPPPLTWAERVLGQQAAQRPGQPLLGAARVRELAARNASL
jgi:hypothetical protein